MSIATVERPAEVSTSRPPVSRVDTVRRQLAALRDSRVEVSELTQRKLLPHGETARRIDTFSVRRLNSLPTAHQVRIGKPLGGVVAIGWYVVPWRLTADHFEIMPGHETFEAATQSAACFIRSIPECRHMLPVLRGQSAFTPHYMVRTNHQIQSVTWITRLNEDLTGDAEGFVLINGANVMDVAFGFALIEEETFPRARNVVDGRLQRQVSRSRDRIIT